MRPRSVVSARLFSRDGHHPILASPSNPGAGVRPPPDPPLSGVPRPWRVPIL
ncbi:hypothetical protein GJR88_03820 [Dietzia sp. DQ12-45-1b]|nr:hypothetical protein GJR88_03820 [Dietzia sp. DQ12-45-1b]